MAIFAVSRTANGFQQEASHGRFQAKQGGKFQILDGG
jgi:hypothetical protein